jgi:hypothetical protein
MKYSFTSDKDLRRAGLILIIPISFVFFLKIGYALLPRQAIDVNLFSRGAYHVVVRDTTTDRLSLQKYSSLVCVLDNEMCDFSAGNDRVLVSDRAQITLILPEKNNYSEIQEGAKWPNDIFYRAKWESKDKFVVWVKNGDLDFDYKYVVKEGKVVHVENKRFSDKSVLLGCVLWCIFLAILYKT